MAIELTGYDRPHGLRSTTYLRGVDIESTLTFEPCDGGTRLRWSSQATPHGPLRLLRPLIESAGRRQGRRTWAQLKDTMEQPADGRRPT